jgi:hypothetical protein
MRPDGKYGWGAGPLIPLLTVIQSGLNSSPDYLFHASKYVHIGLRLKITPNWAYFVKRAN